MINKKVKISIKDVAKDSGLSIATVSNALTGNRPVSKKSLKKVKKSAKELQYNPNIFAQSLKNKKTRTLGVIVPHLNNPFFSEIIDSMLIKAKEKDYILLIGLTNYGNEEEQKQVKKLISYKVDGLIFICGFDNNEFINNLYRNCDIPLLLVDRDSSNKNISKILVDNISAMKKATNYICKFGHKKIGYLSFSFERQKTIRDRYYGFISALKENRIKLNKNLYIYDNRIRRSHEIEDTYRVINEFIKGDNLPTAFVTVEDYFAIGLISALNDNGYEVPKDVSVIGYDDLVIGRYSKPKLTTVYQPKRLFGTEAVKLIFSMIENQNFRKKKIVLQTKIIERESIAAPRFLS